MKNRIVLLLLIFGAVTSSLSQKLEKSKKDKNLTITQTYIDDFKKIIIGEDLDVELMYNKKPSVEIKADNNHHEHINISVIDSVLSITTSKEIRIKKLKIKVNYGDNFSDIEVKGNAEVRSLTSLELDNASLKTSESARAYLNIKANNFNFISTEKTKAKLNETADNVVVEISDNTKMDALINATHLKMDLYQRTNATIEGDVVKLKLRSDNNSQFNGKNLTVKTCDILAEMDSNIYIEVTNHISIDASGSSEIYLYGNPKITINSFTETSKLKKKEKQS